MTYFSFYVIVNLDGGIIMIKDGEIIQCIKDINAKALFGNVNNLDITTFIVSCILKIDYEKLEGNISLHL